MAKSKPNKDLTTVGNTVEEESTILDPEMLMKASNGEIVDENIVEQIGEKLVDSPEEIKGVIPEITVTLETIGVKSEIIEIPEIISNPETINEPELLTEAPNNVEVEPFQPSISINIDELSTVDYRRYIRTGILPK